MSSGSITMTEEREREVREILGSAAPGRARLHNAADDLLAELDATRARMAEVERERDALRRTQRIAAAIVQHNPIEAEKIASARLVWHEALNAEHMAGAGAAVVRDAIDATRAEVERLTKDSARRAAIEECLNAATAADGLSTAIDEIEALLDAAGGGHG